MLEGTSFEYQITSTNGLVLIIILASSNMLIYLRGSLGFGEEALQSLPGKVGHQVLVIYLSI
jgi:hypothetical protein